MFKNSLLTVICLRMIVGMVVMNLIVNPTVNFITTNYQEDK